MVFIFVVSVQIYNQSYKTHFSQDFDQFQYIHETSS